MAAEACIAFTEILHGKERSSTNYVDGDAALDPHDIAHTLQAQWTTLKPDLDGKIHVIVGDADTFYLDGAAHKLKAVLDGLGAKAEVRFLPGKSHFDLYADGEDKRALMKQIAWQMYAVARPGSKPPAVKAKAD